ncbi:DUF2752 domain-containing protein [Streptomyces sp. NPDC005962]|uniref:DUF2752 domain-containing protein n=1 Tax=Streptomyces sp. NPDC005962 TaxID=3154466 RepID=UPI0033E55B32
MAPSPAARRLLAPVSVLLGVVAAFGYVGAVDPHQPGHYPVCPLFRLTGLYCPGCGGLRSAHELAHGELLRALGDNALVVAGGGVFCVVWAVWCVRALGWRWPGPGPRWPDRRRPAWRAWQAWQPWHGWVIGGAVLAFTVIRNFPFGGLLAP